jgi:hypothetical protein
MYDSIRGFHHSLALITINTSLGILQMNANIFVSMRRRSHLRQFIPLGGVLHLLRFKRSIEM